jgi:phosphate starvation-inducible protein PhoH and related proteins
VSTAARSARNRSALTFVYEGDNATLAHVTGSLDENLRQIENELAITIRRRGHRFRVEGPPDPARRAVQVLEHLLANARRPLSTEEVQLQLVEQRGAAAPPPGAETGASADAVELHTRRRDLHGRTPRQRDYLQAIVSHDLSFGIGPAGTGKTYLAVACAVDALERTAVQRIVLTRPAVEAGERLGFLPGDLAQKVDPYLRPLYDALFDLLGFDRTQRLLERQTIEIAPLAYMRGRTLNQSFVILDEAQNTTPEQMKMFLTRIGFGSKAVVTGDVTQIDLPRETFSGLIESQHILRDVRGIAFTYFTADDVVRHPLVARIVEAYERAEMLDPPPARGRRR